MLKNILKKITNFKNKQDLENAMKGHILAEAKLTGTFTP